MKYQPDARCECGASVGAEPRQGGSTTHRNLPSPLPCGVLRRDPWLDPAPPQPPPMRPRIVGSVGVDLLRATTGTARLATHRRLSQSTSGSSCLTSGTLAAVTVAAAGRPLRIDDHMLLAPLLPPIHRAGAGLPRPPRPGTTELSTEAPTSPVDRPRPTRPAHLVQLLPDAGLCQSRKPPPAGHPAAAAHLSR